MKHLPNRRLLLAGALALAAGAALAQAGDYPGSRAIRFIIPYAPAGSLDVIGRQYALQLAKVLNATVVSENKAGAGGTIGASEVVRAAPDGYTLGMATANVLVQQPLVMPALPFKTVDDYQPIVKLADSPIVLFVRADAPWKTFGDFIADARRNPEKIRASVAGVGTLNDVLMDQLNRVAGTRITTVPFNGASPAVMSMLGGHVEANVGAGMAGLPFVKAGQLRALAVFGKKRYELYPDAVTTLEAGHDVTLQATFFVYGPKGMPRPVLDKLAAASQTIVRSAEFAKFARDNGYVVEPKGPAELTAELVETAKVYAAIDKQSK